MSVSAQMTLSEIAAVTGGVLHGDDMAITLVGTDTRKLPIGCLFIALKGVNFDAHDYIAQAHDAGAAALMVQRRVESDLPQVVVDDTRLALGRLGRAWRQRMSATVVAVTGSNGKTSVKEMIAAILSKVAPTLATEGNLNNDIGVPLMLMRIQPEHRFAVIEMGTNHPGEIGYLTGLGLPDIALITNAGTAHLENLGSVEGVAREKGDIYSGLTNEGVAIINNDDVYAGYWRELNRCRKVMSFGVSDSAEVWASWEENTDGSLVSLHCPMGEAQFQLHVLGRHNVANAMAAAAACLAAGVSLAQVCEGLASVQPVPGRLQPRKGIHGARLIHDAYNANPGSVSAAVNVLAGCVGRRVLVLGDMAELGGDAEAFHHSVGTQARTKGIDALYATGVLTRRAVEGFGAGARHFASKEALISALRGELSSETVVLVKGSRSMRMEQVIEALSE